MDHCGDQHRWIVVPKVLWGEPSVYIPEVLVIPFMESAFGFSNILFATNVALEAVYQVAALATDLCFGAETSLKCVWGDSACLVETVTV